MDEAKLETMVKDFTAMVRAVSKALKTFHSGDKALKGNLGMDNEDGVIWTFQALQGPGKEFMANAKALNDLITKGAGITTPTLSTAITNSRKEPSKAAIE